MKFASPPQSINVHAVRIPFGVAIFASKEIALWLRRSESSPSATAAPSTGTPSFLASAFCFVLCRASLFCNPVRCDHSVCSNYSTSSCCLSVYLWYPSVVESGNDSCRYSFVCHDAISDWSPCVGRVWWPFWLGESSPRFEDGRRRLHRIRVLPCISVPRAGFPLALLFSGVPCADSQCRALEAALPTEPCMQRSPERIVQPFGVRPCNSGSLRDAG